MKYVNDMKIVTKIGRNIFLHSVMICKVRLSGKSIKRREGVHDAGRIKREKLKEQHYKSKKVE